ncbi:MAG TPA: SRPBCC family protein [Planctomycetota bacterium]
MTSHHLSTRCEVPRSLVEGFPFFADARNLDQITPSWLDFKVLTPEPIEMAVGTLIDYRLKVRGVPIRWRSRISAWEPPHRFVDEQVKGPYRHWHHEHLFEACAGGTLIRDEVDYAVHGGWFEPLIHKLFVKGDVERIFAHRGKALAAIFGG